VPEDLRQKVIDQMRKAGLPTNRAHPFKPRLTSNRSGDLVIEKKGVTKGPKRGKMGYVDDQGRIWIKDRAHSHVPDHWDVQIAGGDDYVRVDQDGNLIS
jgi:hypothetical protein